MSVARHATSLDVAALAGVTQPTVSRALRGDPSVSAETLERILKAAAELNYTLDQRAVRLRSASTGVLALVLLTAPGGERATLNPFYFALLGAVEAAAAAIGYTLLVSFQSDASNLRANFGQTRAADATIVIGTAHNPRAWTVFAAAAAAGERIVGWGTPGDDLPTIRSDNHAGAMLAVRHLLAQGRSAIAFVGPGWRRHKAFRERRRGYHGALCAAGHVPIEVENGEGGSREQQGYRAAQAILERHPACDAVFAACDTLAFGVMRAAQEAGRAIPRDLALIGFDGVAAATLTSPTLTTVEQDTTAAGALLVEAALNLAGVTGRPPALVPLRLIERESSASGSRAP